MALSSITVLGSQVMTYQSNSTAISNKFLYYNMEQSPPSYQWVNGYGTVVSGSCITTTRAKYGSYSASSNGVASSSIFLKTSSSTLTISPNTGLSFSMWFYITANISGADCKIFEAGGNNKYFIRIPNNTSTFYFCDKGSAVSFSLNTWNHVVGYIDSNNNGGVYLNGTSATTFTSAAIWTQSLAQVFVCRSTLGSHNSINGSLDDFRIYSKVLTQAEVTAIYTNVDQ